MADAAPAGGVRLPVGTRVWVGRKRGRVAGYDGATVHVTIGGTTAGYPADKVRRVTISDVAQRVIDAPEAYLSPTIPTDQVWTGIHRTTVGEVWDDLQRPTPRSVEGMMLRALVELEHNEADAIVDALTRLAKLDRNAPLIVIEVDFTNKDVPLKNRVYRSAAVKWASPPVPSLGGQSPPLTATRPAPFPSQVQADPRAV